MLNSKGTIKICKRKSRAYQNKGKGQQFNNTGPGTQNITNTKIELYRSVTESNKNKILLINKYIDTTKEIYIICGGIHPKTIGELRYGYYPFVSESFKDALNFKVKKGKIYISGVLYGVNGKYLVKIIDNEIIPPSEKYEQYVSEKFFEIFDGNNIPVLKIDINKKDNSITIVGVFFYNHSRIMVSSNASMTDNYDTPFLLMPQSRRDSIIYDTKLFTNSRLKPLH